MRTTSSSHARLQTNVPAWLAAFVAISMLLVGAFGSTGSVAAQPAASAALPTSSSPAAATGFRFPAYFIEWGVYDRNYEVADVPAQSLTQINYAFINPVADPTSAGTYTCAVYDAYAAEQKPMDRTVPGTDNSKGENIGTFNQFKVLRRQYPNLQVLMSIGGYTLSDNFHAIADTAAHRDHFVNSCVAFMQSKGFDGIDVDWEYPGTADTNNFTALLQSFRTALNTAGQSTGKTYPLSIAAPPAANNIVAMNIPALSGILSWVNVMTYDFGGGFDNVTSHDSPLCSATNDPHGPLWNSDGGIQQWISGGMPAGKLNLGLAYYGRGAWHLQNAGPNTTYPGRFAPITAGDYAKGAWDPAGNSSQWTGVFDYWDIIDHYTGPFVSSIAPLAGLNGYTRYWDGQQDVPFVYNPTAVGSSGTGLWLSYDDPQSLVHKTNYARTMGLGGVFAWELSQETHPGTTEHPLTSAIANAIAGPAVNFTCGSAPASTPTATTVPPTATNVPPTATSVPPRLPLPL